MAYVHGHFCPVVIGSRSDFFRGHCCPVVYIYGHCCPGHSVHRSNCPELYLHGHCCSGSMCTVTVVRGSLFPVRVVQGSMFRVNVILWPMFTVTVVQRSMFTVRLAQGSVFTVCTGNRRTDGKVTETEKGPAGYTSGTCVLTLVDHTLSLPSRGVARTFRTMQRSGSVDGASDRKNTHTKTGVMLSRIRTTERGGIFRLE